MTWDGKERRNCDQLIEKLIEAQQRQQKDTEALHQTVKDLAESIKDIVAAHGAIKMFGSAVRWIAGTLVACYVVYYMWKNGSPPP